MSMTTDRISQIQLVLVPSADQDRSVAFYEALGFKKRNDIPWGDGYRWVEVYPPSGTTGIALVPPRPEDPIGVQTGIILNTSDIDATHAPLQAATPRSRAKARRLRFGLGPFSSSAQCPRCFGSATPTATSCYLSRWAEAAGRRESLPATRRLNCLGAVRQTPKSR